MLCRPAPSGFAALAGAGASWTPWARAATAPVESGADVVHQNWLFGGVYRPGAEATRRLRGSLFPGHLPPHWAEDVFAYDDYDSSNGNAYLKPPVSGVPYMVSESVGALAGAPLYRWVDIEATLAVQANMHAQVHSITQSTAGYAGLLAWAGIDYASLNGGNRIWHNIKWRASWTPSACPSPGRRCIALSSIRRPAQ